MTKEELKELKHELDMYGGVIGTQDKAWEGFRDEPAKGLGCGSLGDLQERAGLA